MLVHFDWQTLKRNWAQSYDKFSVYFKGLKKIVKRRPLKILLIKSKYHHSGFNRRIIDICVVESRDLQFSLNENSIYREEFEVCYHTRIHLFTKISEIVRKQLKGSVNIFIPTNLYM